MGSVVLIGKFIAVQAYSRKLKRTQISILNSQLKELVKEQ